MSDDKLVERLTELSRLLESDQQSNRYLARQELAGKLPEIIAALQSERASMEGEIERLREALNSAALGFEKHARHWQASAERTSLIEDRLRAENAQALAEAMRAAIARQRQSQ